MINSSFKKNLLLIIIIFKINIISSDYISIPFKKFQISKSMLSSTDKFVNDYLNNNIYMNMKISQPSQNIIAKINILEFELLMKNSNKLPFENINSNFSKELSSSFSIIPGIVGNHFPNSKYVKDTFNFCIKYDIKNKKCNHSKNYNNINFIYSEDDETEEEEKKKPINKYSYIEIGLSYKSYYNLKKNSLLNNLITNNYIKKQIWFIHFFNKANYNNGDEINNENNDEGILVFGVEPADFFGIKINKNKIVSCQGINQKSDYKNNWSIIFQEVKQRTLKADNKDLLIQNNLQGVINYNYNVVVGNNHYLDIISNTFFWSYIAEGVCKKELANNKFYFFVCNSMSLSFKQIKENFPSLYFKQNEFDYTFELTAQDLFVQIDNQIFFLVVFNKNNPTSSFLLGNIFLKKYFFSFDNKLKQIKFYKENKIKGLGDVDFHEPTVLHWYNSTKIFVIMIIMIVFFSIFGFYFGKKIYQRRRLRACELEEKFDYNSQLPEKKKKYELEMRLNF